jgi:hypothetical protein
MYNMKEYLQSNQMCGGPEEKEQHNPQNQE